MPGSVPEQVIHDLKNPLNSIRAIVSLIHMLPQQHYSNFSHYILDIDRITEELNLRIEDILDTRYKEKLELMEPIDIVQLSRSILKKFTFINQISLNEITYSFNTEKQLFVTNPKAFISILENLLSNAIKNSPPGETIMYTSILEDDLLKIRMFNKGDAIVNDQKLFSRFLPLGIWLQYIPRNKKGLRIVQKFTSMLGGIIFYRYDANSGSMFQLEFPLHRLDE